MNYQLQICIPDEVMMNSGYVERAIEELKRRGAEQIFKEIYNLAHPVVVETHIETWRDYSYTTNYKLHYRLTAVQTRHIEMPVFEYVNHSGKIEWKCPACSTINPIEATYCGEKHERTTGCNRPREKTRQWYEANCLGVYE